MTNTAGHTKRALTAAFLNAGFNIGEKPRSNSIRRVPTDDASSGNLVSPQTFRVHDAPVYLPAKITLVVGCCVMAALALMLYAYYRYCNARREARWGSRLEELSDEKAYAGLTDKQNRDFRYVL